MGKEERIGSIFLKEPDRCQGGTRDGVYKTEKQCTRKALYFLKCKRDNKEYKMQLCDWCRWKVESKYIIEVRKII